LEEGRCAGDTRRRFSFSGLLRRPVDLAAIPEGIMKNRPDAAQLWAEIEEQLVPALSILPTDRAVYFYLVRRSRLAGRRKVEIGARTLSRGSGISRSTTRNALRRLVGKGLLRILKRSYQGLRIEVLLPREIPGCVVERIADGRRFDALDFYSSNQRRSAIYRRERGRCFYCLRRLRQGSQVIDHVVPQAQGGTHSYRNLVACCALCNMAKRDRSAAALLRDHFRSGKLDEIEFQARLTALRHLARGKLKPPLPKRDAALRRPAA
jgi:hypothetical protein